jgi:hypothetical protein
MDMFEGVDRNRNMMIAAAVVVARAGPHILP